MLSVNKVSEQKLTTTSTNEDQGPLPYSTGKEEMPPKNVDYYLYLYQKNKGKVRVTSEKKDDERV